MQQFTYKCLKQLTLCGTWVAMGMFLEIIGPTLRELKENLGISYEEISRCLAAKSVGFFAGSVLGGPLHERFYTHTDLLMSLGIFLGAVGIGFAPAAPSTIGLAFLLFLTGTAEGLINTGGNTMVLHLWGTKAASPMCSLHLGFGLGAFIVPYFASPFIVDQDELPSPSEEPPTNNSYSNISTGLAYGSANILSMLVPTDQLKSNLLVPYGIVAAVTILFSLLMFCFYFIHNPLPPRETAQGLALVRPADVAFGSNLYGISLLLVMFVYYFEAVGGERAYGKFITPYAAEACHFRPRKAAKVSSVFWICHMTGRLAGAACSNLVPVSIIIAVGICFSIMSSVVLAIFSPGNPMLVWIFSATFGVGISLMFPSGMSWMNLRFKMNSMVVMVLLTAGAAGGAFYHYVVGYLFGKYGPQMLMYMMVFYSVLFVVVFICMHLVYFICGKKAMRESAKEEGKDALEDQGDQKSKGVVQDALVLKQNEMLVLDDGELGNSVKNVLLNDQAQVEHL